jgi:hypothetical protein
METKKNPLPKRVIRKNKFQNSPYLEGKKRKKGQNSPYLGNEQDSLKILLSSFSLQKETGNYTYPYKYILIARAVK